MTCRDDRVYDAVVVGGGPVGFRTAGAIARKGHRVVVLEEHAEVGRPLQCAGLVSPRVIDMAPFSSCVIGQVKGGYVHSPRENVLHLDAGRTKALIIDRVRFDRSMASWAATGGAEIRLKSRVTGLHRDQGGMTVSYRNLGNVYSVRCRVVVGADGPNSLVRKTFDLNRPERFIRCYQAEFLGTPSSRDGFLHIFTGEDVSPGFFAWAIPTPTGYRVGLGVDRPGVNPKNCWKALLSLSSFVELMGNRSPGAIQSGIIPLGQPRNIVDDRVVLVGDSACQVKPTSGGGIYTGLLAADHAADTIHTCLEKNELSLGHLKEYQKRCQSDVGRIVKKGMRLNKAFMHLSDEKMEEGFKMINRPDVISLILRGDIDKPYAMATSVIRKAPGLVKFAGPYLRSYFK